MLKREKEQHLQMFAKKFVDDINRKRLKKGDLPLTEDEIKDLIDKLDNIRNQY